MGKIFLAVICLLFGIGSLIFCFINSILGLIIGVVGFALGIIGLIKKNKKLYVSVGILISIIGIILSAVFLGISIFNNNEQQHLIDARNDLLLSKELTRSLFIADKDLIFSEEIENNKIILRDLIEKYQIKNQNSLNESLVHTFEMLERVL